MAKEFKEWDKRFSRQELESERHRWLPAHVMPSAVMVFDHWPHEVQRWDREYVQMCVYHAADADHWQRFRVSLKGMTTREKLYCLNEYGKMFVVKNEIWHNKKMQMCRIDNYIGALVRGGQLDSNHRVVK